MNETWLKALNTAMKGPVTLQAHRNVNFNCRIWLPSEYDGSTLRGQVRLYADAPGSPLVSFTVSDIGTEGDEVYFDISILQAAVAALPEDDDIDGRTILVYDLLLTPDGEEEDLLFGGEFIVIGGVTL